MPPHEILVNKKNTDLNYKYKNCMIIIYLCNKDQRHNHGSRLQAHPSKRQIILTLHNKMKLNIKYIQKKRLKPEKSSQTNSTGDPGKYLPKSTTVVTPLASASLLALNKASLLSSTDTSGIHGRRSFIAESTSNPVGSAHNNQNI